MAMKTLFLFFIFLPLFLFAQENSKRLLVLGDSLTEGYGVAKNAAYPALLEKKIHAAGKKWIVINAGVSGATSASGVARLKWQLKTKPDLMILALGANDGLRGLDAKSTEKNLTQTIELAQKEKIPVILAGMMLPPNYGADYRKQFQDIYLHLAKKYKLQKIPFLLEGVGGDPALNLADGIHPNEKGHQIIADHVYDAIQGLL
jgi:acyl-CoA thioesterase-1